MVINSLDKKQQSFTVFIFITFLAKIIFNLVTV